MRIEMPFEVDYLTEGKVTVDNVIDGLLSAKLLIEEGGYNLSKLVPGLEVEQVQINVRSLTQESPLKELFAVTIYAVAQKDLEREVSALIETVTGSPPPEQFRSLLTLSVLVALFYGASYVKDLVSAATANSKIKRQLEALVKDMASRTGRTEADVQKILDENYKPKGKLKILGEAAHKFFRPSKAQANAPIRVNDRRIETDLVADVPADYAYEEILDAETARAYQKVDLELHAQDKDRELTGWAAVPKGVSDRRLKMRLLDGVTPGQLWGHDQIRGDIVVKYKRVGTELVPTEIHLTRVL